MQAITDGNVADVGSCASFASPTPFTPVRNDHEVSPSTLDFTSAGNVDDWWNTDVSMADEDLDLVLLK